MQGVKKSDVHVSYQNDKVVVSWETVTVEDKLEDGKIVRERRERKYVRTLPLPEGTKVRYSDSIFCSDCSSSVFSSPKSKHRWMGDISI